MRDDGEKSTVVVPPLVLRDGGISALIEHLQNGDHPATQTQSSTLLIDVHDFARTTPETVFVDLVNNFFSDGQWNRRVIREVCGGMAKIGGRRPFVC